jgi:FG-GAP repeat protein
VWTRSSVDRFGAAVLVTELNGDRCADLVIGSPGHAGTGAVVIALGGPDGWGPAEATIVPTPTKKVGAEFGAALTIFTSYRIEGPFSLLGVGMPGYPVNGRAAAGAVVGYPIPGGILGQPVAATQDTPGVAGGAEAGDRFGSVLSGGTSYDLLVGVPLEDVGGLADAGTVASLALRDGRWTGREWSEDSLLIPGVSEAGDQFGAAVTSAGAPFDIGVAQITVGVPGEDIGSVRDVGTAVTIRDAGEETSAMLLHQDGDYEGAPVPGSGEAGDRFGASLGFWYGPRRFALVVGVPGEDVGSAKDAGALITFESPAAALPTARLTEADVSGGHVEVGDHFGTTVASGPTQESSDPPGASGSRLVVGIPGEDVRGAGDAGAVAFGDSLGPLRAVTLSAGERAGLGYGRVLAAPTWSF